MASKPRLWLGALHANTPVIYVISKTCLVQNVLPAVLSTVKWQTTSPDVRRLKPQKHVDEWRHRAGTGTDMSIIHQQHLGARFEARRRCNAERKKETAVSACVG